jgi:gluconolactonase
MSNPSALILTDAVSGKSEDLLNNFQGRPFNSINDVIIHHANDEIWFTDPTYGYEQAFRPSPDLPSQIYRFKPSTGQTWCVADGFVQCNGLCFSPDYKTLYVTDTGACQAHTGPRDGHNFSMNPRLPATIYSFDVTDSGTTLSNRKTFAFCDSGVPDGIKCDEEGNVYSGCGDGVHVWSPQGTLIGKIVTGGCVANFCWSKEGMWMFGEEELYLCKFGAKGALVDVECE